MDYSRCTLHRKTAARKMERFEQSESALKMSESHILLRYSLIFSAKSKVSFRSIFIALNTNKTITAVEKTHQAQVLPTPGHQKKTKTHQMELAEAPEAQNRTSGMKRQAN